MKQLGLPVPVGIDDDEPDIFFVRSEQQPHLRDDYFSGSRALIVEIVSRGTRGHDLKTKAASYHEHHVEEYWAVDLEKQCFFQHLLSNGYQPARFSNERVISLAVHGFWIEASWLWRKPLPAALGCLQQILAQP
jgi:Uma2 family endonuclease